MMTVRPVFGSLNRVLLGMSAPVCSTWNISHGIRLESATVSFTRLVGTDICSLLFVRDATEGRRLSPSCTETARRVAIITRPSPGVNAHRAAGLLGAQTERRVAACEYGCHGHPRAGNVGGL